jgi:hypothetical protein
MEHLVALYLGSVIGFVLGVLLMALFRVSSEEVVLTR